MWQKINNKIEDFLNSITMYRLVLYGLIILIAMAMLAGGLQNSIGVPYSPVAILLSATFLTVISLAANDVFAQVFKAPKNSESTYITALILALIMPPLRNGGDLWILGWTAILSIASKYILAVRHKHVFNPAALGVAAMMLSTGAGANWWVGNAVMSVPVAILGYLVARKIRKEAMVYSFAGTAALLTIIIAVSRGTNALSAVSNLVLHSSLLFLAGVMLTEPLTSPTKKLWQIIYGVMVGILFLPQLHIGDIYLTPEEALLIGNIMAYAVSPKYKLILKLKDKIQIGPDTFDFLFPLEKKINYRAGQYMEWTLEGENNDERGNRRYFTLASSPTEDELRVGIKFAENGSSFKKEMMRIEDTPIVASQLAGDFVLPKDKNEKLVFVAGGIGITPFRSMIKYLIDTNEKRDVVLIYSNRKEEEIVYREILTEACEKLGLNTIYVLTDKDNVPNDWKGKTGRISIEMIEEIPDYRQRTYFISGPQIMVGAIKETLRGMGIRNNRIKTDYFPGFV